MPISKKSRQANAVNAQIGGLKASEVMTDQQKRDRAQAGGVAVAAKMTPAQRSERARNAALARHGAKNTRAAAPKSKGK